MADILPFRSIASIQRFTKYTAFRHNGCVEWTGRISNKGYGFFTFVGDNVTAHRVSYVWANSKEIPKDRFVCHKCDNKRCVNPEHLYIGSRSDNAKDFHQRHPNAHLFKEWGKKLGMKSKVLSDSVITHVFFLRDNGLTYREIGDSLGINFRTAFNIVKGISYKKTKENTNGQ